MDWHQLQVQIPYLGNQMAAWLYTDQLRANALQIALQQCPGAPYRVLPKNTQIATVPSGPPDWYKLMVQLPHVGAQQAAWLYTDQARAGALQMALQACPGAPYRVLTKSGQPVIPQNPSIIPGLNWPPTVAA